MAKKAAATGKPKRQYNKKPKPAPATENPPPANHNGTEDDALRAAFLQHRGPWNEWQAKKKALGQIEKDLKAAIKADGFKVKQFEIADALSAGVKREQKIVGEVRDRLQVARWLGHPMGKQMDLFEQPDRTPAVENARDLGKQDCMEGKTASPPYDPSVPQYQEYLEGYHAETERRVKTGIKPTDPDGGGEGEQSAGDDDGEPAAGWGESKLDPSRPLPN